MAQTLGEELNIPKLEPRLKRKNVDRLIISHAHAVAHPIDTDKDKAGYWLFEEAQEEQPDGMTLLDRHLPRDRRTIQVLSERVLLLGAKFLADNRLLGKFKLELAWLDEQKQLSIESHVKGRDLTGIALFDAWRDVDRSLSEISAETRSLKAAHIRMAMVNMPRHESMKIVDAELTPVPIIARTPLSNGEYMLFTHIHTGAVRLYDV